MSKDNSYYMREAVAEGEKGRLGAAPNPWVGCLIVKNDKIIGRGHHHTYGSDHAEVSALKDCGKDAEGATCYVTLEPCNHHGKTPPCTEALLAANIKKVVIGTLDPDPKVSGSGASKLRNAGITVQCGVAESLVQESLAPYLHHRKHSLPYVTAKIATTIDNKIATASYASKWITGSDSRVYAHSLRARSQAILIGANTALYDKPSLTVRDTEQPRTPPIRCLLDPSGKVPAEGPLFDTTLAPTWIFTSSRCANSRITDWENSGAKVIVYNIDTKVLDVQQVLKDLGKAGVLQVLVEGGGLLIGHFIQSGLINELYHFIAPKLLGDQGIPAFAGFSAGSLDTAYAAKLNTITRHGADTCLHYRFEKEIAHV